MITPALAIQGAGLEDPFSKPGLPRICVVVVPPEVVIVSEMVVVCVIPPPLAVTVTVTLPVVAVPLAVNVRVELPLPGAAMGFGLKLAVTPEGIPEAESDTAALKPPLTVVEMVLVPELP